MKSLVRPRNCPRPAFRAPASSSFSRFKAFGFLNPFKLFSWFNGLGIAILGLSLFVPTVLAQFSGSKIAKIEIRHRGPVTVSDELIRANIRVKVGDPYLVPAVDDDVRNLYSTGFFYNIQVGREEGTNGFTLVYVLQEKPRLTELKFRGNKKFSDAKLRKKITTKVNEPLDERKLFTDTQTIQEMYQKAGYPRTEVKYEPVIEEAAGRATVTFVITESPKVKIVEVNFVGANAFKESKLRKVIKTRRRWMFSWITQSGYFKDDVLEDDKEKLAEFYHDHGYIDFDIKDVKIVNPTPRSMIIRFIIYEGQQYKVGSVKFTGNKLFTTNDIVKGMRALHRGKAKLGPNGLEMDVGDVFTPKGFSKIIEQVEDFYGSRGYIDVSQSARNLNVLKIPNTESGTMDIEFQIDEGQKSYIEKIEIRGNINTKDKVIRRELAVSPGEVFDMVRVKVSKERLEGLQYFEPGKVDARPEPTDPPIAGRKNLVVGVEEKNTGNVQLGAAFSSIDEIVGFAELNQGNFDIFNPPTFRGGGQKFRLRIAVGTVRQDYIVTFVEPWFLGRKLALSIDAYHTEKNYQSLEDIYDETRTGASVGLTRALGSDFLIGSVGYTIEDVGISLNNGFHGPINGTGQGPGSSSGDPTGGGVRQIPANVPPSILNEVGHHLLSRVRTSIAFDTRGGGLLPNKGQRTEVMAEVVGGVLGGDKDFYKLHLQSAWYFRGFGPGHVLEVAGRSGVAASLDSQDVPFYERWYLGGLNTLRGYKYRSISPREGDFTEPVGGDTYWFGYAEYSIPIFQQDKERGVGVRLAAFYDVGNVESGSFDYYHLHHFNDNWGIGLRLNLPIGPLRLDYGVPITHDQDNGSSGRFQFGVGYTREF
jgi:outer membrane protein insertion porin family